MASPLLTAIIERLTEKTKAKNPGIDLKKKPPKPKKPKEKKTCSSNSGLLH